GHRKAAPVSFKGGKGVKRCSDVAERQRACVWHPDPVSRFSTAPPRYLVGCQLRSVLRLGPFSPGIATEETRDRHTRGVDPMKTTRILAAAALTSLFILGGIPQRAVGHAPPVAGSVRGGTVIGGLFCEPDRLHPTS